MNRCSCVRVSVLLAGTIAIAVAVILHEKPSQLRATARNELQTAIAEKLPDDITLSNLKGHLEHFSRWQGHLLLINFWAPWCLPCREEIPTLIRVQKKYGRRGFQVVGVAVDDPAAARRGARLLGITYPILVSRRPGKVIKLMNELGSNDPGGLPFSVLVDPNGHIVERRLGTYALVRLQKLITSRLPAS